ncbi:MAG: Radical SAM domain protein [Candidatus Magasanikbacteria bacterium GW2011_GWA2_56_11]|uniref:Radical SAM domain protein n=1 Tax=Candidatus Magasanikbacteria bacterium GW2011_GWA2_56_11 TaxID=1619044 RepID=A0A0G1YDG9_9BACT|nr:MAG: Radical SAM domain protein [Candidatus Magasanikbacteria bacterium GW2011_GWA2_56_11]
MDTDKRESYNGFRERGGRRYQSFALELVPGSRCQLRCLSCYKLGAAGSRLGDMPSSFVRRVLSEAETCGFAEAVFIGGEPTLHPALPELARYARERGLTPIICTNGLRLSNPGYVDALAHPGTVLVVHAPLPDSAIQDRFAGVPGYADKLRRAYANIRGRDGIRIIAEIVVVEEFLAYIPDVYRWCLDNGITPFIELNRRNDARMSYGNACSPEEIERLFSELAGLDPHPPASLVPPAYGQPCTMSITGVHVKNLGGGDYGGVYSCCAQGVRHGDLTRETLAEVLSSPTFSVFRHQDSWIHGPCRTCPDYSVCRGGCRGEAYLTFGCPRASSPVCWRLPADVRSDPAVMAPKSCAGCPLLGNPACTPRCA